MGGWEAARAPYWFEREGVAVLLQEPSPRPLRALPAQGVAVLFVMALDPSDEGALPVGRCALG